MTQQRNKTIVNCETGEATTVPMTESENAAAEAEYQLLLTKLAADQAAEAAKIAAKESAKAKLEALGLSESEIQAIIA